MVNLDPAAEYFAYEPDVDMRELIAIEDVMEDEELRLGPNGGLVFCMEHLTENFDWLKEQMDPVDDDYFLIDCSGQIEVQSCTVGTLFKRKMSTIVQKKRFHAKKVAFSARNWVTHEKPRNLKVQTKRSKCASRL